jgi:hypothetical protein
MGRQVGMDTIGMNITRCLRLTSIAVRGHLAVSMMSNGSIQVEEAPQLL